MSDATNKGETMRTWSDDEEPRPGMCRDCGSHVGYGFDKCEGCEGEANDERQ